MEGTGLVTIFAPPAVFRVLLDTPPRKASGTCHLWPSPPPSQWSLAERSQVRNQKALQAQGHLPPPNSRALFHPRSQGPFPGGESHAVTKALEGAHTWCGLLLSPSWHSYQVLDKRPTF